MTEVLSEYILEQNIFFNTYFMKYRNAIIILGFLVVVIQFLGFPQSWRKSFHVAAGALTIAFGYLAGRERPIQRDYLGESAKEN